MYEAGGRQNFFLFNYLVVYNVMLSASRATRRIPSNVKFGIAKSDPVGASDGRMQSILNTGDWIVGREKECSVQCSIVYIV